MLLLSKNASERGLSEMYSVVAALKCRESETWSHLLRINVTIANKLREGFMTRQETRRR